LAIIISGLSLFEMRVKFLHVREVDPDGVILPYGGMTAAYSVVDTDDVGGICVAVVKHHPNDPHSFEYARGREYAAKKLMESGPDEVLPLEHPYSHTITDWIANQWCPSRRKYCGYAINIWPDEQGRWVSDFTPAQCHINEHLEGDPAL
jgi:hypothetical protein